MKLLISAAEASADLHASHLVRALKETNSNLDCFGIGGKHLEAEGLVSVARADDLAVMGSIEVLSRLSMIRRAEVDLLRKAKEQKPDVAVLVDYPGFHFRVGPRLRAMGIPVVYYIPPKVWVWRKRRVQAMKSWVSHVICVLPFEPEIYRSKGIPADYVGSPLLEELPISLQKSEARAQLGLSSESNVLAMMPGSRESEIKSHFTEFLDAATSFAQSTNRSWQVLIPVASTLNRQDYDQKLRQWSLAHSKSEPLIEVRFISEHGAGLILRSADLGLIKSGTSTLEAAVLDCPMVIAYRPSKMTTFAVRHLIRHRGPVGLVNLYRGWKEGDPLIAPEVLHEQMTASRMAKELFDLYSNPLRLVKMRDEFRTLRESMGLYDKNLEPPSARAARLVMKVSSQDPLRSRV